MNLNSFTIDQKASILDAIEKINTNGKRFILVENKEEQVIGLATDGDIRRAILKGINLGESISKAMNKKFFYLNSKDELEKENKNGINFIPIIHQKSKKLVEIIFKDKFLDSENFSEIPALIMAGGFGKRLRPLTNHTPKPMLEISGIPLLEITINYLKGMGINRILISTHHLPEKIMNYFGKGDQFGVSIDYIHEKSPSGTAGCLGIIPENFSFRSLLIINGDILTRLNYLELIKFHIDNKNDLTIATNIYEHQIPYGVLQSINGKLLNIVEKPIHQYEISAGIYLIKKSIINAFLKGEIRIDMPDLISMLLKNKNTVGTFPIHEYWLDIGKKNDFERAQNEMEIYFNNE